METELVYPDIQTMDEGLELIFSTMIKQGNILDAIDFIKSLDLNTIPSKTVLRTIIFEILMKNDDIRNLALSFDYLVTILNAFPPNTEQMRSHYYDSIRDSRGHFDDLWSVLFRIINSYFYHHTIYDIASESNIEPIKYPNCKFLLEFYVKLFSIDFEYLYAKSFQPCLMMQLLWPNHTIVLCNRTEELLKWINDIYYNYYYVNKMGDLLKCLHEMLTLMVKCVLEGKFKLSELAAYKHPCLSEIVEATVNFCKNSFDKPEKVKLFLVSLSSLKCFQARMSERIIRQVLKQVSKRTFVLTLKDIVFNYMFPQKCNSKWKPAKPSVSKEKYLPKRLQNKERKTSVPSSDKKSESTKIHDLVRRNKFGDLFEAVHNQPDEINTRDRSGSTPLHLACEINSFLCATVLLEESKKDTVPNLDLTAVNVEGNTALHLAVKANSVGIAKELLSTGGPELLDIKDKKGFKPSDWCSSKEMENLLQSYQSEINSDSDPASESNLDKEAPNFKCFNDYSIYLHALTCLIGTYCEMFNLYEFTWKKIEVVKNHTSKECCHYLEEDVCSEDARIIFQMPDLIEKLIESLEKNASKHQYNIDIELIPLKALAASLKTS